MAIDGWMNPSVLVFFALSTLWLDRFFLSLLSPFHFLNLPFSCRLVVVAPISVVDMYLSIHETDMTDDGTMKYCNTETSSLKSVRH